MNIVYKREFDQALKTAEAVWPQGEGVYRGREGRDSGGIGGKRKSTSFAKRFANPYVAAERGYIDAVDQAFGDATAVETKALDMLATKRDKNPPKKHGEYSALIVLIGRRGHAPFRWRALSLKFSRLPRIPSAFAPG